MLSLKDYFNPIWKTVSKNPKAATAVVGVGFGVGAVAYFSIRAYRYGIFNTFSFFRMENSSPITIGDGASTGDVHQSTEINVLSIRIGGTNTSQPALIEAPRDRAISDINNIPELVDNYLVREGYMGRIDEYLASAPSAIKQVAIVGVTGAGKSELAKAYAKRFLDNIKRERLSTTSSSPPPLLTYILHVELLLADYEQLAQLLNVDVLALRQQYQQDMVSYQRRLVLQVQEALKLYPNWLLIFDNVTNLNDISDFIPRSCGLTSVILYTSQNTRLLPSSQVDLSNGLTREEAVELLGKLTGIVDDEEDATDLAKALDKLPLAIQVAGRYIAHQRAEQRTPGDSYANYYYLHQVRLEALDAAQQAICEQQGMTRTQYVAIQLSVERLPDVGKELLTFCGLLDYVAIPEELICAYTAKFLGQGNLSIESDDAIKSLRQYGLLNLDSIENKTWSLHQITHNYAWHTFKDTFVTSQFDNTAIIKALSILLQPIYEGDLLDNLKLQKRAAPHVQNFFKKLTKESIDHLFPTEEIQTNIAIALRIWAMNMLHLGMAKAAKSMFERSLLIQEKYSGKDDLDVISTLVNLSSAYYALGDIKQQKILLERALPVFENRYGKEHPQVAVILTNLGIAYNTLQVSTIQNSDEATGAPSEFTLNEDDFFFVGGRKTRSLEDAKHAKGLLERALAIQETHNGKSHITVATVLVNLASVLSGVLDEPMQAKALLERALVIQRKYYPAEHPVAIRSLVNLGHIYGLLNNSEQQVELFEQALSMQRKHYGKDHPQVARTFEDLSLALKLMYESSPTIQEPGCSVFEPSEEGFNLDRQSEMSLALEEFHLMAATRGAVGPDQITGWRLQDVPGDGNCFYYAVIHHMRLIGHPFLSSVPEGTEPHNSLRLHVQGEAFQDQEWADDAIVDAFVRKFDIVLAVVNTQIPTNYFIAYFRGEGGDVITNTGDDGTLQIPTDRPIIRLAATGNHFLSVIMNPALETGALRQAFDMRETPNSTVFLSTAPRATLYTGQGLVTSSSTSITIPENSPASPGREGVSM